MARRDWKQILGWTDVHLQEIRHTAYAYIRQGKYDVALPLFEALVAVDSNNVYDCQMLGAVYVQIGQAEKAIKYLNRALQTDAEHSPTLLNLAKAFFMSGRKEEGLRLSRLLQKDADPYIAGNASALVMCHS